MALSEVEKNYLSLREASSRIPYSQDYLRLLIRLGYLRGVKLGRNWFTREDWIEEYIRKYSRKLNGSVREEKGGDHEPPVRIYYRYSPTNLFGEIAEIYSILRGAIEQWLRAFLRGAVSIFKTIGSLTVDYRYVIVRLALLFLTAGITTTALNSPQFLDFSKLLARNIQYSTINITQ